VAIAGLVFTAVAVSNAQEPAAAADVPSVAVVDHHSTVENAVPMTSTNTYLMTMRGLLVGQERSDQTDAELIASGRAVCANEVADGMTWASLDVMLREADLNVPFYRAYVQTAVATFCPGEM